MEEEIQRLKMRLQESGGHIRSFSSEQQSFLAIYRHYNELSELSRNTRFEYDQKMGALRNLHHLIFGILSRNASTMGVILENVVSPRIQKWKREQQLAGNGAPCDYSMLDNLQHWCEEFAELIWLNLNHLQETDKIAAPIGNLVHDYGSDQDNWAGLRTELIKYMRKLVTETLIIEKQPPQVLKTNTRFSVKVRSLLGNKLNSSSQQMKANLVSEVQAYSLLTTGCFSSLQGATSGDIQNNTGCMEYDAKKHLTVSFGNMQLKKIRRADKKGTESVIDEKFCLVFTFTHSIGNLEYEVWTMSLPLTVIVHGNQEPHAWAAITWDNAFSDPNRIPFTVPEKACWGELAYFLNLKFNAVTSKPLSEDAIKYLAEKLFGNQVAQEECIDSKPVSCTNFCKTNLPERNFTFWDWFYSIMKLTKEHLKPLWKNNLIHGFIGKRELESLLSSCPVGTFLLRFSESELGGITIAWVGLGSNEDKKVTMLQPFTAKDFAIRSLADRINDLSHLLCLYPNLPKNQAFGQYYSPLACTQRTSNGYLQPLLVTHVPGLETPPTAINIGTPPSQPDLFSYPSTPHSFNSFSPADQPVAVKPESYTPSIDPNAMDFLEFASHDSDSISFFLPNTNELV